ncbi:hypothetical protein LCGC14_3046640, partial [marine sediment metagenome]
MDLLSDWKQPRADCMPHIFAVSNQLDIIEIVVGLVAVDVVYFQAVARPQERAGHEPVDMAGNMLP